MTIICHRGLSADIKGFQIAIEMSTIIKRYTVGSGRRPRAANAIITGLLTFTATTAALGCPFCPLHMHARGTRRYSM